LSTCENFVKTIKLFQTNTNPTPVGSDSLNWNTSQEIQHPDDGSDGGKSWDELIRKRNCYQSG